MHLLNPQIERKMSTYFEYSPYVFQEHASSLEHDIAKALQPKPEKVKNDYWVIKQKETPTSYQVSPYWREYASPEEALTDLRMQVEVEPASSELIKAYFPNEAHVYADKQRFMQNTQEGEKVPVLYAISHCLYESYPADAEVLDLSDDALALLKEAYTLLRKADIYSKMADQVINESETAEGARAFLADRLDKLTKELETKDWSEGLEEEEE